MVDYELQGPTGVPLEGAEMGNKSRDVAAGFLEKGGKVKASSVVGKQVAATTTAGKPEIWQTPLRYIGVDVQYFTALVLPLGDQLETPYLNASKGVLVGPDLKEKSDVSVLLTSKDLDLPPAADDQPNSGALTHKYLLFVGPKRELLLRPIGAEKIINYGSGPFAFPSYVGIPQGMLALLGFFHNLFPDYAWPYGWAIIMLTVVVRSSLFPFSRKQAISAAKMQELQPEIVAIKKKYGSDHEKLGRAQMELYRKHNFNPLGGCLLMFVQLPIFIGLYQALNVSVDMRSAKFLWINNLAAPDALFRFPFALPFLGSEFNLLPIITMVLMLVQQKLFMPPAADEQAAMQQKMMTYMMVFMGFMFYWMPAGLCVYFIASSLWGLAERKLLPKKTPPGGAAAGGIVAAEGGSLPSAPAKTASMWTEGKKKSKRR